MRFLTIGFLVLTAACAGTLYQRYAGTVPSAPDDTYACIQAQLTKLEYRRTQFDATRRWYLAQKDRQDQNSSGLYRKTADALDVRVQPAASGGSTLEIAAHTYQEYANARGVDQQEQPASDLVKRDAQLLARACSGTAAP
jgi:hypothetical protein